MSSNAGYSEAVAETCADLMQILDGMPPHVWHGQQPPKSDGGTCSTRVSMSSIRATAKLSASDGISNC
jgi:hypothetical protein